VTTPARQAYVNAVAKNYVRLPGTPLRASRADRRFATLLYEQRVPLSVIYAAFLLVVVRREIRSSALPRLPQIRTLAYFHGAIDELLEAPLDEDYARHLATKITPLVAQKELRLRALLNERDTATCRLDTPSDSRGF
jgi:hypothetical protein